MFKKVSETEQWKTYTQEKALMNDFLSGDELQSYFLEERDKHRGILRDLGESS
jgi:tripartite-type tricarboxylate transporter receptor subunit TctC